MIWSSLQDVGEDVVMTAVMLSRPAFEASRDVMRSNRNWTFVDAYEFQRLAIGRRKLSRADDLDARVRGLHDEDTGETFVVEDEKLFRA